MTRVLETAVHPANGRELLTSLTTCGGCLHFDRYEGRCLASREARTTAAEWPACVRFAGLGRAARAIRNLHARPFKWIGAGAGALVGLAMVLAIYVVR